MKKTIALLLAVVMVLSLAACGSSTPAASQGAPAADTANTEAAKTEAAKTYELRASTNLAATSTVGQGLAKFVELVNEKSAGQINATANYGSELGNQAEQVAMAIEGDLEMVIAAPGTGPGSYEGCQQMMLFEFPFLFKDNDHYRRVMKDQAVLDAMNRYTSSIGLTAVAGMSQGSRDILTNVPVNSMADMQDLIMRGPNAVYISMFEAVGAAGITMDWNEIYTAMSQKVCNGCEGSPSSLHASSFEDNGKYLAITNHIIACAYMFFNTKWFNALPAELQTLVTECAAEAQAYQEQIDDADQGAALEAMKANGVTVTEMTDIAEWKEACAPMTAEYLAKGAEWEAFYQLLTAVE